MEAEVSGSEGDALFFPFLLTCCTYETLVLNDGGGNGYLCHIPDFSEIAFTINFGAIISDVLCSVEISCYF